MNRNNTPEKKPGWKKKTLIVLAVILGIALAAGGGVAIYVHSMLNLVQRPVEESFSPEPEDIAHLIGNLEETEALPETEPVTEPTEPDYSRNGKIVNVLLVGQDMRPGEDHKLSDTIILCTVNRETKTLTLSSFQRDMYVKLPDMWGRRCGKNRINTAYALGYAWKGDLGAMEMMDQLILEQFGVEVDHNIEIDFESFEAVVDAVGGIDIQLTEEEAAYMMKKDERGTKYTAGENHMDGYGGLHYARMRHSSGADNDFHRTERQRTVIRAVLEKCRSLKVTEMHNMMTKILPMVLTDMTNDDILSLAEDLLPIVADLKVESQQIPAPGTYSGQMIDIYDIPSAVLVPDIEKNREILMAIAEEPVEAETGETQPEQGE